MPAPLRASAAPAASPRSAVPPGRRWIAGAFYFLLVCSAVTIAGTVLATAVLLVALAVVRPPLAYDRVAAGRYVLPFLALLGVMLVSALVGPDRLTALREANEYRLVLFPLMLLFVLPQVSTRRALQVLCVTAVLMTLYGAYQYLTVTDPLYWYRTPIPRARGGFTHQLTFAGYMLLLAFPFAALAAAERTRWRWGWALGAAGAVAAIVLSHSRSGMVGLAVGGCVLLYRWSRRAAVGAVIAAAVGAIALVSLSGPLRAWLPEGGSAPGAGLLRRFLVVEPLADRSIRDRLYIWESGLRGWRDRPLLGHGSGMHSHALEPYQRATAATHGEPDYAYSTGYNTSLHNVLVRMLFDLGLAGLAVYVWMWVTVFRTVCAGLRGAPGRDPWRRALLWGLAAGFAALNAAGLFEDNFFDSEVQTLALILMMTAFHVSREGDGSGEAAPAAGAGSAPPETSAHAPPEAPGAGNPAE